MLRRRPYRLELMRQPRGEHVRHDDPCPKFPRGARSERSLPFFPFPSPRTFSSASGSKQSLHDDSNLHVRLLECFLLCHAPPSRPLTEEDSIFWSNNWSATRPLTISPLLQREALENPYSHCRYPDGLRIVRQWRQW